MKHKKIKTLIIFLVFICASFISLYSLKDEINRLPYILQKTSEYCEKLKQTAFHFVCHQVVTEKIIKKLQNQKGSGDNFGDKTLTRGSIYYGGHKKTSKYIYDYSILQNGKTFQEKRYLLRVNRKKVQKRKISTKAVIFSYMNALAPIDYFAKSNQHLYGFNYRGIRKLMRSKVYEVEVFYPKTSGARKILAIFWIDAVDFSIIKYQSYVGHFSATKLVGSPDNNISNIKVNNIHYFGIRKRGIRFPSKTEIAVSFNGGPLKKNNKPVVLPYGTMRYTLIKTNFNYKNYMFYNVKVSEPKYKELK